MASLKDMRVRIAATKATQKITKAMQMVAASKLRRRVPDGFARAYVVGVVGGLAGSVVAGLLAVADPLSVADPAFLLTFGAPAAIAVTAVLWALLHIQYSWFFIVEIVTLGLFFGWMRWKSGSTLLTIALHATNNGLAMAALAAGIQ